MPILRPMAHRRTAGDLQGRSVLTEQASLAVRRAHVHAEQHAAYLLNREENLKKTSRALRLHG